MKNGFTKWLVMLIGAVAIVGILVWGIKTSEVKTEQTRTENSIGESTELSPALTEMPTPVPMDEEDLEKELQETETGEIQVVIDGLDQL